MSLRLLVLAAAFATPLAGQRPLTVTVVSEFGGLQDDPANELIGLGHVIRLPAGQTLVTNGKPLEVRLYDAKGVLKQRIGRAGAGPGEFRYAVLMRPWTGDSVLTLSTGTRRWMLYGFSGKLVREWPVDSAHPNNLQQVQLAGWAYTRADLLGSRGCLATVVARLPVPATWSPRQAATDPAGRLWVQRDSMAWEIYSPTAQRLGSVTLPDGFTITQFAGSQVIGRRIDRDGGEFVTTLQVGLPAAPGAPPPCAVVPAPGEMVAVLRKTMGQLRTAGEAWFSDNGGYPAKVPTALMQVPDGVEVTVIESGKRGWAAVALDPKSGARCFFAMGSEKYPAWPDGTIGCTP